MHATDELANVAERDLGPEDRVLVWEALDALTAAIRVLPRRWQVALLLDMVEEVPVPDGAARMGVAVPAYRALTYRARKGLRAVLHATAV